MLELSKRDKEIASTVIEYAISVRDSNNSDDNEKQKAQAFIDFVVKYNEKQITNAEMKYIKNYISVWRMNKEMQQKREKDKIKLENQSGKKRKILNNSKFYVGGWLYDMLKANKSEWAVDYKIGMESVLFAMVKIASQIRMPDVTEYDNNFGFGFLRSDWTMQYMGWQSSNGLYLTIAIPKKCDEIKYNDYVFIRFHEKDGFFDYADFCYRQYDYKKLDAQCQATVENYQSHPLDNALALFFLRSFVLDGVISYDELTKRITMLWEVDSNGYAHPK